MQVPIWKAKDELSYILFSKIIFFFCFNLFHHFYTAAFGSIPELPATNCREIKLSEGEQAFSGKYWYYNPWTETATFAYCDMKTEGNL